MMFVVDVIFTGACSELAVDVYDPLAIMPLSIGSCIGARGGLTSTTVTGGDSFTTARARGGLLLEIILLFIP